MSTHAGRPGEEHPIGVLLVNSGSPDSLAIADVRDFLRQLLSDPRVIETPRALWLPILHGAILPTRPRSIVRKYRKIWTPYGSPLLLHSRELQVSLSRELALHTLTAPFRVEIAMLYSQPSVKEAIARLCDTGVQKILVLPLFPQYCAATTGRDFHYIPALDARPDHAVLLRDLVIQHAQGWLSAERPAHDIRHSLDAAA